MPFWEYIQSIGIPPFRLKAEISSRYAKSLGIVKVCVLLLMDSSDYVLYCLKIDLFAYLGNYMAIYG